MSEPYIFYQGEDIALWCGRWEDVLPTLPANSVSLTIIDPPYGTEWQSGIRSTPFPLMAGDDGTFDIYGLVQACGRVSRRYRHLYVFGLEAFGPLTTSGLIGGTAELIWDKGILGPGDLGAVWGPAHERIAFGVFLRSVASAQRGSGRLAARLRRGSVLRYDRPNAVAVTRHPTEKPVGLLRELIEASSLFGETVLDPCCGVGSTLVAARLEGRQAIGVEVEARYCEVAAERLRRAVGAVA